MLPSSMARIAIDARKWRDYGIGTYVRNLVRHLARLDRESTYFVFCNQADVLIRHCMCLVEQR